MTPQRTNETVVSFFPLLFLFGVKLVGDAVTSAVSFSSPQSTRVKFAQLRRHKPGEKTSAECA